VFVDCRYETTVTKSSVRRLTDERLPDFLRVLNADRARNLDYAPLTVREVEKTVSMHLVSVDSMFLGFEGTVPASTARLVIGAHHEAALCDLAVVPGRRSAGNALVERLLAACREAKVESISAWLTEHEVRFSDILSSYTFEPRRVRVTTRTLLQKQSNFAASGSFHIMENQDTLKAGEVSRPFENGRGLARDLAEIRNDLENRWHTAIVAAQDGPEPIILGQLSDSDRKLAVIRINERAAMQGSTAALSPELIKEVLGRLYDRGAREVLCEVDSDTRVKTPILEAGFVPDTTLFQFVLELAHEEPA